MTTTPTISDEDFADFLISIDEEPLKKQVRLTKKFIAKVVAEHITPEKRNIDYCPSEDCHFNACVDLMKQNISKELGNE